MICWLSETDFFGEQPARKAFCVLQYPQELGTLHPYCTLASEGSLAMQSLTHLENKFQRQTNNALRTSGKLTAGFLSLYHIL